VQVGCAVGGAERPRRACCATCGENCSCPPHAPACLPAGRPAGRAGPLQVHLGGHLGPRGAGILGISTHTICHLTNSPFPLACRCIPVVIQDQVEQAWHSILDLDSYTVRIAEKVGGWWVVSGVVSVHG